MRRGGLFFKYAVPLVLLVSGALVVSAMVEIYFSYQENKAALSQIQRKKALAAAERIEQFVRELEHQLGLDRADPLGRARGVAGPAPARLAAPPAARAGSYGSQPLRSHRARAAARVAPGDGRRRQQYGFLPGSEVQGGDRPQDLLQPGVLPQGVRAVHDHSARGQRRGRGRGPAEANLKFIWDVVSSIKVGEGGRAYVVDRAGAADRAPDISLVLQKTDVSALPQIQATRAAAAVSQGIAPIEATFGRSMQGKEVLSDSATIDPLGWLVFVDLPIAEAFAPIYASVQRTVVLLLVGLAISVVASLFLVRRMVSPVQTLQAGAARIGSGALDHRIAVKSGDELGALAGEFNRMAEQLQEYTTGLEQKVEARTRELTEALEQQTATAEILRVISSSPNDLQPVLDEVAKNAANLCDATDAFVMQVHGNDLVPAALYGSFPSVMDDGHVQRVRWGPDARCHAGPHSA